MTELQAGIRFFYPCEGSLYITQSFGANPAWYGQYSVRDWDGVYRKLKGHEGIDLRAAYGSKISSCLAGKVFAVSNYGAYGIHVRVQSGDMSLVYAHLKQAVVRVGQDVIAGELLGYANNTGASYGSHLHLTLKIAGASKAGITHFPGDICDPTPYLIQPHPGILKMRPTATAGLRVRSGPGLTYSTLAFVYPRDLLTTPLPDTVARGMLGKNEWMQIHTASGLGGFCWAYYLTEAT